MAQMHLLSSHRARVGRFTWFALAAIVCFGALTATAPAPAQDGEAESLTLEEEFPEADAEQSGEAGAAGADRTLLDTVLDGGIVGLLIGLLSLLAVGMIVEHLISIRKSRLMPEDVLHDLEEMISRGQINQALDYCYEPHNQSLATDVIRAGLERYRGSDFGFAEYKTAVEEEGEDQTGHLYRKTDVLGVIGAVAPMLGLTGTVLGMIESFNTIAAKGGMARPDELAGGIGKALVTTLLGLIVAIPAMIAFSYFRNRIDSLVAEAGKRVERVLTPLGRKQQTFRTAQEPAAARK